MGQSCVQVVVIEWFGDRDMGRCCHSAIRISQRDHVNEFGLSGLVVQVGQQLSKVIRALGTTSHDGGRCEGAQDYRVHVNTGRDVGNATHHHGKQKELDTRVTLHEGRAGGVTIFPTWLILISERRMEAE